MKVLFVTPSEVSSGEVITALHVARSVRRTGGCAHFLASAFAARFLRADFGAQVTQLGADRLINQRAWSDVLGIFQPDIVVFADYPLLFFPNGVTPLVDDRWVVELNGVDPILATFDHLGYAQRSMTVFFGPAHVSFSCATTPSLPERMQVLLPCPSHEPGDRPQRRGIPFRYWHDAPSSTNEARRSARKTFVRRDELLIFHSSSHWAWQLAQRFGLPHYDYLPKLLGYYLGDLPQPVTIVSVNNGRLLPPAETNGVHIVNLPSLPSSAYEALLLSCDLLLTDNCVSVSLAKAVCGLIPSVHLRNSFHLLQLIAQADQQLTSLIQAMEQRRLGAIFPYEVFPIWGKDELQRLRLFESNSISDAFAQLELFGGAQTRQRLHELLLDDGARGEMRKRQAKYAQSLAALPEASDLLRRMAVAHGMVAS